MYLRPRMSRFQKYRRYIKCLFFFSVNEVEYKSESGYQLLMCSTGNNSEIAFILFLYLEHTYAFTFFHLSHLLFPQNFENIYLVSTLLSKQKIVHPHIFTLFLLITSFYKMNFITFFSHKMFSILKKN